MRGPKLTYLPLGDPQGRILVTIAIRASSRLTARSRVITRWEVKVRLKEPPTANPHGEIGVHRAARCEADTQKFILPVWILFTL